jgi:hypothetical protein
MQKLQPLNGPEFDRAYMQDMVQGHTKLYSISGTYRRRAKCRAEADISGGTMCSWWMTDTTVSEAVVARLRISSARRPAVTRLRRAPLCAAQLSRPSFFVSLRCVRVPPSLDQPDLFRNLA